jgi:hypothetical protein
MEWLWLLLFLAVLGVLWGAIKGTEWLIEFTKEREHFIRVQEGVAQKLTEKEAQSYLGELERRERIDAMVNWEDWPDDFETASPKFKREFNNLSAEDLCEVIMQRREKNIDKVANAESVKTTASALKKPLENKFVVKNGRKASVVNTPRGKQAKQEQKIFDQMKKRYSKS